MIAAGASACNTPTKPATGQASMKTPVVFVHGWFEGNTIWGPFQNALLAAGYKSGDITNFGYNSTASGNASSAATVAGQLGTAVNQAITFAKAHGNPNATKVDIISHSYGGMVSRYCLELGGCNGKVAHWVSLAGADGGTAIASIPAAIGEGSGKDMSNNSAVVQQLKSPANVQKAISGGTTVHVFWSKSDGVINPAKNSQWPSPENPDPASNTELGSDINHMNIFTNQQVIAQVIQILGGGGTPPPTTTPTPTTRPATPTTRATVPTTRAATTTTMDMGHGDHDH